MSVLNRAMFNQTVNRQVGSPISGERSPSLSFFENLASALRGTKNAPTTSESDDSTV